MIPLPKNSSEKGNSMLNVKDSLTFVALTTFLMSASPILAFGGDDAEGVRNSDSVDLGPPEEVLPSLTKKELLEEILIFGFDPTTLDPPDLPSDISLRKAALNSKSYYLCEDISANTFKCSPINKSTQIAKKSKTRAKIRFVSSLN